MNGCEPNEVLLRSLPIGAAFELTLTHTTGVRGVVVQHCSGSTIVDVGKREHWCYDAPIVPHPEILDAEAWIKSNLTEEITMANGENKVKKVAAKAKGLLIVRYSATNKKSEKLMDVESKSSKAFTYRAIKSNPKCTFEDIWAAIYRNVTPIIERKGDAKVTIRGCIYFLVRDGFVKSVESREEVESKSAAA